MGDEMMCQKFMDLLDGYIDDVLTPEETAFMKAHADKCENCAEQLRLSDIIKNEIRGMDDDVVVPIQAQAAWRSAVRKENRNRKLKKAYKALGSIAAAFVVLVGATFAMRSVNALPPRVIEENRSMDAAAVMTFSTADIGTQEFMVPETAMRLRSADHASGMVIEADGETDGVILTGGENENIIKSCDVVIQSESIEEDVLMIYELTDEYEGYVSEDKRDFAEEGTHADIVSRIPVDLMDDYISAAENIGVVESVSRFSQNADEIYFDIDSRLESKKALSEEMNERIKTADDETIVTLNEQINQLYSEIDTLTRLQNTRDNDLLYAKVRITLLQKAPVPVTPAESTLKDRSARGFMQSLSAIGDFLQDMVVSVAVILPVVLFLSAVALVVLFTAKKVKKNKRKKEKDGDK